VADVTLGIILWFTGFVAVRGEWFLMWQSPSWNGTEAAFRFSATLFLTLLFTVAEDRD
jgi:predicted small integral membrane protein